MSIYLLKSKFQNLLRPLVHQLAKLGITANQITVLACLLSVAIGLYFYIFSPLPSFYFLIPAFMLLRMMMNAVDGMLAREHNMQSRLGAVLNELTDVISDVFLYYPLGYLWGVTPILITLFIFLCVMTEMAGLIGLQIGSTRRYDGPFGKSDRAFAFGLLSLLYALNVHFSQWIDIIFVGFVMLLVATIINRAQKALG